MALLSAPNDATSDDVADDASQLDRYGVVQIGSKRYLTAECLAGALGVTVRTLKRWDAARTGPPRIKIGKTVLFDQDKLPSWLENHEVKPFRGGPVRRAAK